MAEPPFEPEPILRVLQEHEVDYVLIGGMAAIFHGSPVLTQDVDITPAVNAANLSRLSDALTRAERRGTSRGVGRAAPVWS